MRSRYIELEEGMDDAGYETADDGHGVNEDIPLDEIDLDADNENYSASATTSTESTKETHLHLKTSTSVEILIPFERVATLAVIPGERKAYDAVISPEPSLKSYLLAILKQFPLLLASAIGMPAISIYSLTYLSGISPKDISWEWWSALPLNIKVFSIALMLINFGIGTTTRMQRIPNILKNVKELFYDYCKKCASFLKTNTILTISVIAAISALALGYYGFVWSGQFIAISNAALNFISLLGFRIEALPYFIKIIRNYFDKDFQFQQELAYLLYRIKPEHIAEFETFLKNETPAGNSLDDAVIGRCLFRVFDKASARDLEQNEQHPMQIIFNAPTVITHIKNALYRMSNIGFAAGIGTAFSMYYIHYGFEGIKLLFCGASDQCWLNQLPYYGQMLIAIATASSSSIVGIISGSDFTGSMLSAVEYMKASFKNKVIVVIVGAGSILSATSIAGAVLALTDKPNLFNITTNSAAGKLLLVGNWMLSTSFDLNSIMSLLTKNEVSFKKMLQWLEKNKLSDATLNGLREHSFFKPAPLKRDDKLEMKPLPMKLAHNVSTQ